MSETRSYITKHNNFLCDNCNNSYITEKNFNNHKCNIKHNNFLCENCNKSYITEKNFNNHKCNIIKSKKCFDTKDILFEYFEKHLNYHRDIELLDKKYGCSTRLNGLNENISENIIKFILHKNNMNCNNSSIGDLIDYKNNIKYECKCYTSKGPISFGPTEKWDKLCLLDGLDWTNKKFKLYLINLKNDDVDWKKIKITKNNTYEDICKTGKRPHVSIDVLMKQINIKYIKLLFEGNLTDI